MKTTIKTKTEIGGRKIVITTRRAASEKFGICWISSNNYGEPRNVSKAFKTAEESVQNEIRELKALLH